MAKSRLGRGLGALFPALPGEQLKTKQGDAAQKNEAPTPQEAAEAADLAAQAAQQATSGEPAAVAAAAPNGTAQADDAAQGAAQSQSQEEAQQAEPEAPISPLDSTIPSMGEMTRNADTVSRLSKPMTLTPQAAEHKLEPAQESGAAQEEAAQPNGSKRAAMPSIGDMAHPSDLFFGASVLDDDKMAKLKAANDAAKQAVQGDAAPAPAESATQGAGSAQGDDGMELKPVQGGYLVELSLSDIGPNLHQPRTVFDENELKELAQSIKEVGVLQPIVVRKRPAEQIEAARARMAAEREAAENEAAANAGAENAAAESDPPAANASQSSETQPQNAAKPSLQEWLDRQFEGRLDSEYELVMGERRWRASQLAGFDTIPAIVKTTADDYMLRDALLENLHRVALNPLEEAAAYQQMIDEFGLTQLQLSKSVSKSRPQIANTLRLMNLPSAVQKRVAAGELTAGHARALLGLKNDADMEALAERIVNEGLSVRSTEEIVSLKAAENGEKMHKQKSNRTNPWSGSAIQQHLEDRFDTKVTIKGSEKHGRIEIVFSSPDELDRIAALLAPGETLPGAQETLEAHAAATERS